MRRTLALFVILALVAGLFSAVSYAAAPDVPTGLSVTVTSNSASLSWPAVAGATSYQVYRSTDGGGTFSKITGTGVTSTSYTDVGLTADSEFYYKVSAVSGDGESDQSSAASGKTAVDFGPNVHIFDSAMSASDIQSKADSIYAAQEKNQFGNERDAIFFKPGTYNVKVKVGFNTQVAGLGQNPGEVNINGGVDVDAKWQSGNATLNFWRSVENLSITPTSGTAQYAVAQAAPMRRVHIKGSLNLFDFDPYWNAGWASGGYLADSIIDGSITPASQQQWFSRNNQYSNWSNGVWNMVFVGDAKPPAGNFPEPPYTVVDKTPVIREKPYLYVDSSNHYQVFVPSLQKDRVGVSWAQGSTPGQSIPISEFYIADPVTSNAAGINAALNQGKNVLFTPGIYHLDDTVHVTHSDTVVLGLGMATLMPDTGKTALAIDDVDGVKIAGLLFDAGPLRSPALLEVGQAGSSQDHSTNPTSLHDLFFRVGGDELGTTDSCIEINSNNVIGDHFWVWRADHGEQAAWNKNVSTNGLIVNGNDVTLFGLFNEHHNEYQTLWNGNGGRTYFYQSEIPYDPPTQNDWMSHGGTVNGYASYKVADNVTTHEAWGLGIYSYFRDAAVKVNSAIEVPNVPGVQIHHATTIWLNGMAGSEITHIVNNIGDAVTSSNNMRQTITEFKGGDTVAPTIPGVLSAVVKSDSQVDLSWDASTDNVGVEGYNIYRDGVKVGSSKLTKYSDTNLNGLTTYSYKVTAVDAAGNESAFSDAVSATTPVKETALDRTGWTATASVTSGDVISNILDGKIQTRWSAGTVMVPGQYFTVDMKKLVSFNQVVMDSNGSNDYARGYEVYVSNDGSSWGQAIASGIGDSARITITFAPQTARYIKIIQTGSSSSWWSIHEFNVYTDGTPGPDIEAPSAPANLTAIAVSSSRINLSWAASTDNVWVTGYEVYRDGLLIASPVSTTFSDTGLAASTAYSYTVKAKDAAGNVSTGSTVSATTQSDGGGVPSPILVAGIEVTGTDGVTSILTKGGTLQLHAAVLPTDADDLSVVWAVYETDGKATAKATISSDGVLTAVKNGSVRVEAAAHDGSGVTGYATILISGQDSVIVVPVPVTSISVTGEAGATSITAKGGTLQLHAAVLPANADDTSVVWAVYDTDGKATDKATISSDGLLTAVKNGSVRVEAAAHDGSGVMGSITLAISSQEESDGGGGYIPPYTPPASDSSTGSLTVKTENGKAVAHLENGQTDGLLSSSTLQGLGNQPLELQADGVTITVPASVIQQLLAQLQKDANTSVKVHLAATAATSAQSQDPNLRINGKVYDMSLTVTDKNGQANSSSGRIDPVQVILPYRAGSYDEELLGVYAFNEVSKEWEYVGGKRDSASHTFTIQAESNRKFAVMEYDKTFTDVPAEFWAYRTIQVLSAKHIVSGVSASMFEPNRKTTRAEFVAMLVRALDLKPSGTATSFGDVHAGDWYAPYITAASANGLVSGITEDRFAPNEPITREQMAALIVRSFHYLTGGKSASGDSKADLKDGDQVSGWAKKEVDEAITLGLMKGQSGHVFAPKSDAIRSETAQAILNLMQAIQNAGILAK